MKPIGPTSRHLRGLSRRDVLWTGGTGLAAGLLTPGLVGLAVRQSSGAGMDMQGHARAQQNRRSPRALPKRLHRSSSRKSAAR